MGNPLCIQWVDRKYDIEIEHARGACAIDPSMITYVAGRVKAMSDSDPFWQLLVGLVKQNPSIVLNFPYVYDQKQVALVMMAIDIDPRVINGIECISSLLRHALDKHNLPKK